MCLAAGPHCARCAEEVSDLGKHTPSSSVERSLLVPPGGHVWDHGAAPLCTSSGPSSDRSHEHVCHV